MSRREVPTALIGAGRLAGALAPLLAGAGYPVVAVASPGARSARRLKRRLGAVPATADPVRAVRDAVLVLLAVPDPALGPLARRLASGAGPWAGRTVLHHAGALGVAVLAPLARAGAGVGVLHPLQALAPGRTAPTLLSGSAARVEGNRRGLAVARRLARAVGLRPFALPQGTGPAGREAYHAAAALASNDLVALLSLAAGILERLGLGRREALDAVLPLMRGTLDQVTELGPARALTGPVSRGDAETVRRHLRRLGSRSSRAATAHRALSRELLDLAGDRLDPRQRAALRRLLE